MKWIKLMYLMVFVSIGSTCQSNNKPMAEENKTFPTYQLYVGTASGEESEGIYHFRLDSEDGSLQLENKSFGILNPAFLAISPNNKYLYATVNVPDQVESGVSAFRIDGTSGELTLLNQQSSMGRGACYLSTAPSGQWVLVANYSSGSLSVYPVNEDGSLGEATDVVQHEGSSVDTVRQNEPHAHYVRFGAGNIVYAADLGTDKVMLYKLDETEGKLIPFSFPFLSLSPGNGPRHVDDHPNGQYVYVLNEMGSSVSVFQFDERQADFKEIQTISSLAEGFEDYNKSADIHVHPSGQFLYASNRGDANSIAVFKIDGSTGMLSLIEIEGEGIVWPRNFNIDPSGKYLLVANKNDDSIVVFEINQETGELTPTGQKVEIPTPMCIQFFHISEKP